MALIGRTFKNLQCISWAIFPCRDGYHGRVKPVSISERHTKVHTSWYASSNSHYHLYVLSLGSTVWCSRHQRGSSH